MSTSLKTKHVFTTEPIRNYQRQKYKVAQGRRAGVMRGKQEKKGFATIELLRFRSLLSPANLAIS